MICLTDYEYNISHKKFKVTVYRQRTCTVQDKIKWQVIEVKGNVNSSCKVDL